MLRFYTYAFLSGMQFTWTTWLAFVVAHGGNPGWAEAAYHLAILLGEVPTGAIADLMGRRASMLVGLLLSAIFPLGYFFIHDTLTACLVLGFSGLAGTFISGADTALVYETAAGIGGEAYARKAMARFNALQIGAFAVAPAIAGFLYQWWDMAPFLGKTAVTLVTIAVVWGMKEKPAETQERTSVWRQTATAIGVIRANRSLLVMLVFGWLYYLVVAMAGQYSQAYLPSLGLTMGATGVALALGSALSTGGSALAERLTGTGTGRVLRFAPVLIGLSIAGMGAAAGLPGGALLGPALLIVMLGVDGTLYPIYGAKLNESIPSAQRATILSLLSAGFSMLMTVSFPAASYLPIPWIYLVTGGVALLLALIWALRKGHTNEKTPQEVPQV